LLLEAGLDRNDIDMLLVENPRRLLERPGYFGEGGETLLRREFRKK